MKTNRSLVAAAILSIFTAGAVAVDVTGTQSGSKSIVTAMKADEGVPHNLITAMKADEGVPQNAWRQLS